MDGFGEHGRLIAGRYRLGARIGRGGMGTVWRATDELLGRQVAVKEVHLDNGRADCDIEAERERTLREARTVAQFQHPHVIVLHDVVEAGGRPCIVMELVQGRSLEEQLAAEGPVTPREAARIGLALLGALRVAHEHGVLHRDLKPANVLMERGTGRVVLSDFGVAQIAGGPTITEQDTFVGSPEYTAPERMSGTHTGPESDLWSLGVLLCTALSGSSPFHRDSLGGVLHAVVSDEIITPDAARPLLPLIRGLLRRDPGLRLDAAGAEQLLRAYLRKGRMPDASAVRRPEASRTACAHPRAPVAVRGTARLEAALSAPRTRTALAAAALVALIAGAVALLADGDGGHSDDRPSDPPATSRTDTGGTEPAGASPPGEVP
ncbi:serine/threonine-protein kinase [Streptomyces meridianus]|uniref:serine/threonine-protein kinase n=1 Tax=Streptomyces meridianus TaxID=2938945 RepID=UPI0027E2369F|nr:serine/threonine-protein kinase [Streptomyces meridianus]